MPWARYSSILPRLYRRVGLKSTLRGLRHELHACLPELSAAERFEILKEVQTRTPIILDQEESWSTDVPSREHLEWASSIVAAFEAITRHVAGEDQAIDIMARITRAGVSFRLAGIFAILIRRAPHNTNKTARKLITSLLPQYGYPWKWRATESDNGSWALEIEQCFYAQFMANHGHPRLTRVICALNLAWIDRVVPRKYGIQFDQGSYTTLGHGGDQCRIPFIEVTTSAKN